MADFYTLSIARLLSVIENMAQLTHDPDIASMVTAYLNILQGKERAGLERAMGAAGFSFGSFSPDILRKFTKLIAEQNTYFDIFGNYATSEQRNRYDKYRADPVVAEVERLRTIVLDYPYTNTTRGIQGPHWFATITKKIDQLKVIEDEIALDLSSLADLKLENSNRLEQLYLGLAIVILVLTGTLSFKLAKGISVPLHKATNILSELGSGRLEIEVPHSERRGEIGKLFSGLEKFKSAALGLKLSEESKSSILLGALDAIISINMAGEIVEFNPSAEKMFGYRKDDVTGEQLEELIIPLEMRDQHREGFARFAKSRVLNSLGQRLELKAMRADGSQFDIELSITHIGDTELVTAFIQDITERKTAQMALENSKLELEKRVFERTKELDEAKKLAENANSAKSDFLSSMSHELRTPMNAILGFGQLLQQNPSDPLTENQYQSVEHILAGGHHLLELINDVLDLSKIEAGKIEVSLEDVSIQELLAECVVTAENLDNDISVSLSDIGLDESQILVKSDVTRLRQVLLNLMSNAVKYNRPNGSVEVNCAKNEEYKLRISIKDTGLGIPKEKQEMLFEPFNRLGAETTNIEGTGIGLSITKRLIELMEGEIGFDSEVGVGSTFWVDIPLAVESDKPVENIISPQKITLTNDILNFSEVKSILYIEDNPLNLALMEKIIAQFDSVILHSAHTGELGLAMAAQENPDLIIMDVNLPGVDGLAATRKLKTEEITRNIPIIGLSARALPVDIEKGMAAGFERYLTKPMVITEMVEAIKQTIGAEPDGIIEEPI